MFSVTPIPAFQDNYIWALAGSTPDEIAVVDPGDAAPVFAYLKENNLRLAAILITHHHPDHTGGVADLQAAGEVPVYGPASSPFKGITEPLNDNSEISLLGETLKIGAVPAHTLDHISYFQPNNQPQLFCGDTLFLAGCGRLFEGTAEQLHAAMSYFKSLPTDTQVFCTHEYSLANLRFAAAVEPDNADIHAVTENAKKLRENGRPTLPSDLAQELKINPFMRSSEKPVAAAAEKHAGKPLTSETEILASLRQWKDNF
ncbi:hydroxyacylglutathione hydrolase [Marinobacterium mangrovicola]|uniref:Hydroxyacylglutathione hydrolase n=1 Tax=Marinobacterium mangrovicola TaxID=1476959 RepID=A0A4R1GWQ8_9GAMM|nr:hydroxyacylglutathione hydrolase [Marinobacterium mangrovicola]TCK08862.1 hydroxyacylglutathione hydrolase [Marinobacterium mangrovicola]